MKKIFILIVLLLFCSFVSLSGQSEDIKVQSKKLSEIKKSIKEKEREKNKLIRQERIFKEELTSINDSIGKTEKKLAKILVNIKTTQYNLDNFSKVYNASSSRSAVWNHVLLDDIKLFNKMTFSYEQNPVEYKIRRKSLEYKKENFEKEKKLAMISAASMKRCERSKKDLLNLQLKESKLVERYKNMLKEKKELSDIILNRRFTAEREIRTLSESAKALQRLIDKINEVNKRKRTAAVRPPAVRSGRKKSLPWPVGGKVVLGFGRNKHPDLDTYVISNGIKIEAADFSQVKSVESGIVVFAGQFRSYGKVIIIDHSDLNFSIYGLLGKMFVKLEQKVSKGAVIAELGSGEENNVLYFEIRHNNTPVDPILWLQAK
ncbi:murein hydrolase activator EnvC family protein [Candidatus Endomicrobiellum trichonymphae]|uniref:murein hydrolase activator EnvC family protein n=1 Tax=Endomicrobium trichonymphae TaxID=1408204 RepID=UPI000865983F|nr:peptidoglycan DD-metalloendopeptidase family protein [Candidatus Endomicrobium trichonymphae]BAV58857.1 NlpD-like lipoprotein containing peptidase M23B domain [Candidatus Endomicrobium trichonymphae]